MTTRSDDQIIASFQAGDATSFPVLYRRYSGRGLRYAASVLRDVDDSEEVVQEAFCRLLRSLRTGAIAPRQGEFAATFFKTVRNLAIDTLRRRRVRTHVSLETSPDASVDPASSAAAAAGTSEPAPERVRELLATLPASLRDALELRAVGGLTYDEIAAVLGATHAQVRTWIYRARRSLEDAFAREQSPERCAPERSDDGRRL